MGAILFGILFVGSLITSTLVPWFVLGLFPILFGIPHLFPSALTVNKIISKNSESNLFLLFLCFAWSAIMAFRTYFSFSMSSEYQLYPEIGGLIVLTIFCFLSRNRMPSARFLLIAGLVVALWWQPVWTTALLLLLHNFVAFFFWIRAVDQALD